MVTVFTKHGCPQCVMTKKVLSSEGIEHKSRNVQEDEDALDFVRNTLGLSSLPVVVADGHEPIVGFNPDKLRALKAQ